MQTVPRRRPIANRVVVDVATSGGGTQTLDSQGFAIAAPAMMVEVQGALRELLQASPTPITKAVHVERAFGIDHQTGWQVYQIVQAENPLTAVGHVPPPAAIQRLVKSAVKRRIDSDVVQRVSSAYDAFSDLVQSHAHDRAEFDAMVRALLPEEREKQWLSSKQSMFKGVSQIRGVVIDALVEARFIFPSPDGASISNILMNAEFGLRRLNPAAKVGFGIMPLSSTAFHSKTLDGQEQPSPLDLLIPEFCTSPLPEFETIEIEGARHYWVTGTDMGLRSAIDLVTAWRADGRWPRTRQVGGKQHVGVHEVIDVPTKRLTFDVFAHHELFPGAIPELAVYQTTAHGVVQTIGDPKRDQDRLHLGDALHPIAGGIAGAALGHVPRYSAILDKLCKYTGFRASQFQGYRVDVMYPFYGAQYSIRFALPEKV